MAYTTPATWATNEVVTAAKLNQQIYGNVGWLADDSPRARVYHNTTQSITDEGSMSGNYMAVAFNSELFDTGPMHNTVTNNSRLVVPTGGGGVYVIGACIEFAAIASTTRRGVQLRVNGTTNIVRHEVTANSAAIPLSVETMYQLNAGDYVEVMARQNTGSPLSLAASGGYSPHFWARWVSNS